MKLIEKGTQPGDVTSCFVGDGEILLNLGQRWPADVRFDERQNEFVIRPLSESDRAFCLRASVPIKVKRIDIEKDQVCANFVKK